MQSGECRQTETIRRIWKYKSIAGPVWRATEKTPQVKWAAIHLQRSGKSR
jgi:hypothetical protein